MSLRDRTVAPSEKPGRRHRIAEILDELDTEDADVLRGWLADLSLSPERISSELRADGISVVANSIARYRFDVLKIGDRRR